VVLHHGERAAVQVATRHLLHGLSGSSRQEYDATCVPASRLGALG
jgi:hypothetical protein